jgi:hypothetical protein
MGYLGDCLDSLYLEATDRSGLCELILRKLASLVSTRRLFGDAMNLEEYRNCLLSIILDTHLTSPGRRAASRSRARVDAQSSSPPIHNLGNLTLRN